MSASDLKTGTASMFTYRLFSRFGLSCILCSTPVPCSAESSITNQAVELERNCLQYRDESLRQGFVSLRSTGGAEEYESRIWFKAPDKFRYDYRFLSKDGPQGWNRKVINGSSNISLSARPSEGDVAGVKAPNSEYGSFEAAMRGLGLYHPKWIGMGIESAEISNHHPMSRSVGLPATIERVECAEVDSFSGAGRLWRIKRGRSDSVAELRSLAARNESSFTIDPALDSDAVISNFTTIWLDAGRGHSLVRAELDHHSPNATRTSTVDVTLAEYGTRSIWYPAKVSCKTVLNGAIVDNEVIEITEADFDTTVSDQVFTIEGMDIEGKRVVYDRTRGPVQRTQIVQDNTVTDIPLAFEPAPLTQQTRGALTKWLFVANSVLCTILAALALRKWMRSRQSPS